MSNNSSGTWIVFLAGGIIGFLLIVGLLVVVAGYWLMDVRVAAPPPTPIAAAVPMVTIDMAVNAEAPDGPAVIRLNGTTYAADEASGAALAQALAAIPTDSHVQLRADDQLPFTTVQAVMRTLTDAGITHIAIVDDDPEPMIDSQPSDQ